MNEHDPTRNSRNDEAPGHRNSPEDRPRASRETAAESSSIPETRSALNSKLGGNPTSSSSAPKDSAPPHERTVSDSITPNKKDNQAIIQEGLGETTEPAGVSPCPPPPNIPLPGTTFSEHAVSEPFSSALSAPNGSEPALSDAAASLTAPPQRAALETSASATLTSGDAASPQATMPSAADPVSETDGTETAGEPVAAWNMGWDGKPITEEIPSVDEMPLAAEVSSSMAATAQSAEQEQTAKPKKNAQKPKAPASPVPPPFNGKRLGPLLHSEAMMTAPDGSLIPVQPTVASRLYTVLAFFPLLPLLLILAAQVLFTLDVRDLWYSDEVRYANAFQNMVGGGHWVVLHLDDVVYPDKPPLYFWFLAALQKIPGLEMIPGASTLPGLFFFGSAVSGLLCLLATYALARLVGRLDRKGALAAGIILLSGFFFSGLLHYLRMDLLFTALITLSHILLFHALVRQKAYGLIIIAFLSAGAATLTKGPFGLALPLLAGIFFVIWQGRFRRLFRLDMLLGLFIGLAVPAVWLYFAWQAEGQGFIDNIFNQQIVGRALDTWHHPQPWYHYGISLPLIWLPWTLLLFFLPWGRVFKKETRTALKASRTPQTAGLAYLWCSLLSGLLLLSAISIKLPIYCLPLFPPLAVLSGRALLRLRPSASKGMQWALAIVLFLVGLTLLLLPLFPSLLPLPVLPEGLYIAGGVALAAACMMAFLPNPRRPEGMLLVISLFTAGFAYPVWSIGAPGLDVFMSPKAQAEEIRALRDKGYYAGAYKVYGGTYSYYAGTVHEFKTWEAVQEALPKHPNMVLALRASFWDDLAEKPSGFVEIDRQRIAERDYVLVARPDPRPTPPPASTLSEHPEGEKTVAPETTIPAVPPAKAPEAGTETKPKAPLQVPAAQLHPEELPLEEAPHAMPEEAPAAPSVPDPATATTEPPFAEPVPSPAESTGAETFQEANAPSPESGALAPARVAKEEDAAQPTGKPAMTDPQVLPQGDEVRQTPSAEAVPAAVASPETLPPTQGEEAGPQDAVPAGNPTPPASAAETMATPQGAAVQR